MAQDDLIPQINGRTLTTDEFCILNIYSALSPERLAEMRAIYDAETRTYTNVIPRLYIMPSRDLTDWEKKEIRRLLKQGVTHVVIKERMGKSRTTIARIAREMRQEKDRKLK